MTKKQKTYLTTAIVVLSIVTAVTVYANQKKIKVVTKPLAVK